MQFISVFLDITKVADLRLKSPDASKTHGVCHVIFIIFGSGLGKVQLCQISSLKDMCDRF